MSQPTATTASNPRPSHTGAIDAADGTAKTIDSQKNTTVLAQERLRLQFEK